MKLVWGCCSIRCEGSEDRRLGWNVDTNLTPFSYPYTGMISGFGLASAFLSPMFFKRFLYLFAAAALTLAPAACGSDPKDDPDTPVSPDKPDTPTVDPDKPVEDPVGTITLSMRDYDNGDTSLGNIYIRTENFRGRNGAVRFSSVGTVNGLGNVAYIPSNGWTDQIKVTPGEGYVAYDTYQDKYYRIYVVDYITSTLGGIIGADIKYQEPFNGVDEEIQLTETALSFGTDGGSQALFFDNSHILVYDVESDASWCKVEKATSLDRPFLYNGLVITVEKTPTPAATATVTVTTAFGKTKTINVSYAGYEPYVTVGDTSALSDVGCEGGEFRIGLTTNCSESIELTTSGNWIQSRLENGSEQMRRKAKRLTYVNGQPKTRSESYNDAKDIMTLVVKVEQNGNSNPREGRASINWPAGGQDIQIKQKGYTYLRYDTYYGETTIEIGAEEHPSNIYFSFETSYSADNLEIETGYGGDAWFDTSIVQSHYIAVFNVQANTSDSPRQANITLKSKDGLHSLTYSIIQKGMVYYVSITGLYEGAYYVDRHAATYSLPVSTNIEDLTFTSSAPDWVTATYTAGNVVLRFKAATEDRKATITCSNAKGTFEVHQSKYAVNDEYSEGKIEGKVYKMENGTGYIYKTLEGTYAWSTENVVTGCGSDGKKNMEIIRSFPDWQNLYPAFAAVDALNTDGVTGWYMPTRSWLNIEGWSSTEENSGKAWYDTGAGWYNGTKQHKTRVHAVHEFTY